MQRTSETLQKLVAPVYLPIILGTIGAGMMIPVLPLYLNERGLSLRAVALVLAGAGLGSLIGSMPAGSALARFGERSTMLLAFLIIVASTAPLGFTDAVGVLVGLRIVFGVAGAGLRLSRQTFITRRIPTNQRGRALSFIGGSYRVALLIGPFLGGLLVDRIGFRSTFLVAASFGVAGLLPGILSNRSELDLLPDVRDVTTAQLGMRAGVRLHWRRLMLGGPAQMLVMAAREGRFIVLPLIARDLGMSLTQIGLIVTISTAADLMLFPVAGLVMDRFGRLAAMVPSFITIGAGLIMLAIATAPEQALVAGIVMGVGNGLGSGTMLTLGSDLAPPDAAGSFLAGMAVMQGAGRVLGAFVVGFVGDAIGLAGAAVALAMVLALAIAWIVGMIGESSDPDRIRSAWLK